MDSIKNLLKKCSLFAYAAEKQTIPATPQAKRQTIPASPAAIKQHAPTEIPSEINVSEVESPETERFTYPTVFPKPSKVPSFPHQEFPVERAITYKYDTPEEHHQKQKLLHEEEIKRLKEHAQRLMEEIGKANPNKVHNISEEDAMKLLSED